MDFNTLKTSDYEIGLTKLIGKPVKEIHGYLSREYDEPTFKLTKVEFEDGTILGAEGEHDFPYLVTYGNKTPANYSDDYLQEVYDSDTDNEDE